MKTLPLGKGIANFGSLEKPILFAKIDGEPPSSAKYPSGSREEGLGGGGVLEPQADVQGGETRKPALCSDLFYFLDL